MNPERFSSKERWRRVDALPTNYKVSSYGRVRKQLPDGSYKILYSVDNGKGYFAVSIGHQKQYLHRLVAMAYVPNPDNLPEIDHINDKRWDNRASNLRWITHQQNLTKSSTKAKRRVFYDSLFIPIEATDYNGNVVHRWPSIKAAAADLGLDDARVAKASLTGRRIMGMRFIRINGVERTRSRKVAQPPLPDLFASTIGKP